MPNPNVQFQGQTLVIPGAYYSDNVSAGAQTAPPPTPPLIFIGYGYGQKPLVPVTYTNPQDLLNAIRGGPCSGFVPYMANPSPQLNGAQLITFINVGENTQATLALNSSGATGVVLMTSTNYGPPSNLLRAEVTAGSTAGKMLTLYDGYAGTELVGDNLGVPFQISYTGAATGGVSYTVGVSGLNAVTFSTASPNANEAFTLNIASGQYTSISQIVQYINGTGFFSAIAIGDGSMPAHYLDLATGIALASGASGGPYVNVTAAIGSVIWWLNQDASTLATGAIGSGVTTLASGAGPINVPFTSFSGAVGVPPSNTDYSNGLNAALAVPGWALFIDSNSAAVQALGQAHVTAASQAATGKWRRFYTGSSVGDSVSTTILNAQNLDSNRCAFVYPGYYRVNALTGINELHGGHHAAAALAGIETGNPVATPATNKPLTGTGVEVNLTQSQINQLQQAGVCCLWVPTQTGIPTIISDLTTWQIDNNPENLFLQQVKCRDYLAYSIVNALQPYVGTIASTVTETQIYNATKNVLNQLSYTPGSNGVLNSWDPASLVLNYNGATQTLAITVNCVLVGQNRFIEILTFIQPLNLTISTSSITPTS